MIAAPRGFRRTLVLHRSLPGLSSRDPGLTHCLRNRGRSKLGALTCPPFPRTHNERFGWIS